MNARTGYSVRAFFIYRLSFPVLAYCAQKNSALLLQGIQTADKVIFWQIETNLCSARREKKSGAKHT